LFTLQPINATGTVSRRLKAVGELVFGVPVGKTVGFVVLDGEAAGLGVDVGRFVWFVGATVGLEVVWFVGAMVGLLEVGGLVGAAVGLGVTEGLVGEAVGDIVGAIDANVAVTSEQKLVVFARDVMLIDGAVVVVFAALLQHVEVAQSHA